ncbi:hypothetical protein COV82_06110 [Candidatus Peregrinibacteria bacterium CG11_big_fil_rev_8_21_14_0_20_46_8]|nr:MAG: hypothetical protein COV82_06110 [Candidatus Peregrinibacteria bacterium CG11_big_fil_rev_8_21_14_0_20_46_8]
MNKQLLKKIATKIIGAILIISIFYFLGKELSANWAQIRAYDFDFDIPTLAAATLALAASYAVLAFGWFLLLVVFRHPIALHRVVPYFFITQPAKYIPGKVWLAVARLKFCNAHNVPPKITFLSTFEEGSLEALAGVYVSVLAILQMPELSKYSLWGVVAIILFGLILLIPHVFYFFINLYLRGLRHPQIPQEKWVSFGQLFILQVTYVVGLLGFGIAQLTFLQSFAPVAVQHIPFLVSIGALSIVAGVVAIFAPGGLGVREGVWYLALQSITAPHIALIYAFVSRFWMIVIEALLAVAALPIVWFEKPHK